MKTEFKAKFLYHLLQGKKGEGFTLIELLVVVIIIGILAAIALPNLLGQVGKGRESELKSTIGTVLRAQQAYHLERRVWGVSLNDLGVTVTTQYQSTPTLDTTNATFAKVATNAPGFQSNGTRAFEGRIDVNTTTGDYTMTVCASNSPANTMTDSLGTAGICQNGIVVR